MKSIAMLVLWSVFVAGMPSRSWAGLPTISADEKSQLAALNQPALLVQSAGERILVIEDGRPWHRHRNGIVVAAIVITAVIVTIIVLGAAPARRGY
jgi:hypothetical protein